MRLQGKVAIVTGGAQGLGRSYALCLAKEGTRVVIADILDAEETVKVVEAGGGEAIAIQTDVTDEASTQEMARITVQRFGRIDILVNNAAIFATLVKKPFYEISAREWDAVLAVNLKGAFLCAKAVFPQMKHQGKGKIINVSSGTFYKGQPLFLHYVTSKGGVIGFTRGLAREVGDYGICVNTIAPGYTETDPLKEKPQNPADYVRTILGARCIKRPEMPDDLWGAIVFLASDDSDFVTGQTIIVDGGASMS